MVATPSQHTPPVILAEATHVCVAGGDGTVRHVGMALARSGRILPMAIWPAGTINLLARQLPARKRVADLAKALLGEGQGYPHHPVQMGETMFFACASIGPDSLAVAGVSHALKRRLGRMAYVVSLLRQLVAWPRHAIVLSADGCDHACEAVFIAKGRYYAGPWTFAPLASPGDGLLHVVMLETARRRDYARFMLDLMLGRDPARREGIRAITCRQLAIASERPLPVQVDGDPVGSLPVAMVILPETLQLR